jgi:hypothetical protein
MSAFKPTLKPLTDRQIDLYALKGHYGEAKQHEWLRSVEQGTLRSLDHQIRQGKVNSLAQEALGRRKKRKARKTALNDDSMFAKLLEDLGL